MSYFILEKEFILILISIFFLSFTIFNPIYINGNSQFTTTNGVVSGTGIATDPYVIENWSINAGSSIGIHIRFTTAYFIIRNCDIYNGN